MNKALPSLIALILMACSGQNISTFSCSIKSNVKDPNGDLIFEGNTGLLTLDKTNKRIGWKSDLSDDEYYMSENFNESETKIDVFDKLFLEWSDETNQEIQRSISFNKVSLDMNFSYDFLNKSVRNSSRTYSCEVLKNQI